MSQTSTPAAIGRYPIVRHLATGGMASIYLGTHPDTGRAIAVKQILPHIATDEEFIKRFVHETRIMMAMKHPNILPILDAQLGPQEYHIVMPFLDRGTLKDLLGTAKRLPADVAVYAMQEILKALDHAHGKGVIHRDLKPSNVMFDSAGQVFLTDFGVARVTGMTQLTQTGEVLGTPAYMSPEQALGGPLTPASDLFSVGVIFYELLTGFSPFATDNPVTTMRQVVEHHPPAVMDLRPALPPSLEAVVLRLMRKQVGERYTTAIAVLEDLMPYWEGKDLGKVRAAFTGLLTDPDRVLHDLYAGEATVHMRRAKELWEDPDQRATALWEAYQASALDPQNQEAASLLERWKRLLGAAKPASDDPNIARLEEKWRLDPGNIQVLLQLGKLYRVRKDYLNLMKVYQRLDRLKPTDGYTMAQMRTLLERQPTQVIARRPEAEAVRTTPADLLRAVPLWGWLILGVLGVVLLIGGLISSGQSKAEEASDLQEAVNLFQEATQQFSAGEALNDPDVQRVLKREKEGDLQGAFTLAVELAGSLPPHPQVRYLNYLAGSFAYELDILDGAVKYLERSYALEEPPQKWVVGMVLAQAAAENGDGDRAEKIWEEIIFRTQAPHAPQALLARAEYLIDKGLKRPATQDLEQLIRDWPDSKEAVRAKALLRRL
jgi:serine/threonine-protein kinase